MHAAAELHPTRHSQSILQVVDGIYAAACGERPWERTLAEVCQLGALDACALSIVDPLERRWVVLASWGLDAAAESGAMPGPIPGDSRLMDGILGSTPGAVWHDRQIRSDALTPMSCWTDRMQADGLRAWACVVIGRDGRQASCLEVYAGARRASSCPELDDLLRQLAPHLTRAWRLGKGTRSSTPATRPGSAPPPPAQSGAAPDPDLAALPGVARLRADFGLTKAEARLALRLAEGSSLASAAQAFSVKLTTIRSQLQQVFAKTGTCRQTELVAMLLSCDYVTRRPLRSSMTLERHAPALAEPPF